jgi:diacylglycerol kinase family enzyme
VIQNPNAASRKLQRANRLARVLAARGHLVTMHDSAKFRFADDAPDARLLCICGGDGTVRMVLDSQADLAGLPPLAIYPVGTINLLARELGYPADPQAFASRLESAAQPRRASLARAGDGLFLACASVGFDANAVAAVSLALKARVGRLAYLAAMIPLLWRWPRQTLQITADGEQFAAEAIFVLRGALYAGPWTLDHRAGLTAPKLHLLAMPRARRRDFAALVAYALGGAQRPRPEWRMMAVSSVDIATYQACPLQLDGDIAGSTPVSISMTDKVVTWL